MKDALRVAGVVALMVLVFARRAAMAGTSVPELDPGLGVAGLAFLGGTAAYVIERYRRRTK